MSWLAHVSILVHRLAGFSITFIHHSYKGWLLMKLGTHVCVTSLWFEIGKHELIDEVHECEAFETVPDEWPRCFHLSCQKCNTSTHGACAFAGDNLVDLTISTDEHGCISCCTSPVISMGLSHELFKLLSSSDFASILRYTVLLDGSLIADVYWLLNHMRDSFSYKLLYKEWSLLIVDSLGKVILDGASSEIDLALECLGSNSTLAGCWISTSGGLIYSCGGFLTEWDISDDLESCLFVSSKSSLGNVSDIYHCIYGFYREGGLRNLL